MSTLVVSRVVDARLVRAGLINREMTSTTFTYDDEYLSWNGAIALSHSLPLDARTYGEAELRPYFEGLLPEGTARAALAARAATREDDYLSLLGYAGLDCIGDVVIQPQGAEIPWDRGSYKPLSDDELRDTLRTYDSLAASNAEARLSLAGTQGKIGLAHAPGTPIDTGWMLPMGGAASTHILKVSNVPLISLFETLCMAAAPACGLRVARTNAFYCGRPVLTSERYDRDIEASGPSLVVRRLHQEDVAQAFGVTPSSKYLELEGGTFRAIARLIYERSSSALADIDQLARIAVFDYAVGNCDNHLKNLSVVRDGEHVRLAPSYDIVCTTFFERFSREMGRRLGSTRNIDGVSADDFTLLARDIGMGPKRMRRICAHVGETVEAAIMDAGTALDGILDGISYAAEDLIEDMAPRLAVVREAAR